MESEKVKEIKECLQSCNDDKMACYDCKYYEKCEKILTKNNILTCINELESENETLRNAKVVYENVDYCYEDLKQAVKEFAEKLWNKIKDNGIDYRIGLRALGEEIDELLKEYEK